MDSTLRCNDLKCRAFLNDQAVVTTCSHIFCLPCADRLDLSAPKDGQRKCPACSTYLLNPDDAVVTSLNPSEDYKTSILSGLSPMVIMECAGRGLQFWAYQMAQEITYQEFLTRNLAEKYRVLGAHCEGVVREGREEVGRLEARVEAMQVNEQHLQGRIQHLEREFKRKNKAFNEMEKLYNNAKVKLQSNGLENAAEQDVDHFIHGDMPYQSSQIPGLGRQQRRNGSHGSGDADERRHRPFNPTSQYLSQSMSTQDLRGVGSSHTAPTQTAASQRQQLPIPTFGRFNHTIGGTSMRDPLHDPIRNGTPMHPSQSQSRGMSSLGTYGISGHARAGRQQQAPPLSRAGYGPAGASGLY